MGIAGVVAAIYPIVSPGGYMLYGRTLPAWQEWGRGPDFHPDRPWLLQPFDQLHFEPVTEAEYLQVRGAVISAPRNAHLQIRSRVISTPDAMRSRSVNPG